MPATKAATTKTVAHTEEDSDAPEHRAIYWDDLDLKAWQKLSYYGLPQYEHMPLTVHNPNSPLDAHNIAYNLLSISDINALGILDTASFSLRQRPARFHAVGGMGGSQIAEVRRSRRSAMRKRHSTFRRQQLATTAPLTVGNVKRMDGVIDWMQGRLTALDSVIARPFGRENTPGTVFVNKAVDGTQWWLWETYRFTQRVAGGFLDEKVLNSIQDGVDKNLNRFRLLPRKSSCLPARCRPTPPRRGAAPYDPPPATRSASRTPVAVMPLGHC